MNAALRPYEAIDALDARVQIGAAATVRSAARTMQGLLACQADFLGALSDEQYVAPPDATESAIGPHVRHCLDHVRAVIDGAAVGLIDYDARDRGTNVERVRAAGISETRRLQDELGRFCIDGCDRPVRVRVLLSASGPAIAQPSYLGRELVFVLSHTVHHHALMAIIARALSAPVPPRFGCAPATIAYLESATCAR